LTILAAALQREMLSSSNVICNLQCLQNNNLSEANFKSFYITLEESISMDKVILTTPTQT